MTVLADLGAGEIGRDFPLAKSFYASSTVTGFSCLGFVQPRVRFRVTLQTDPHISFIFPWGNHKTFSRQRLLCKGLFRFLFMLKAARLRGSCTGEPLHYSEVPGNVNT